LILKAPTSLILLFFIVALAQQKRYTLHLR